MRIAFFYFALYGSVGLILPYLPPYFRTLGFSGKEIALAASVQSVLSIVMPPLWGYLADRTRRPVAVLRLVSAGAALAFVPMFGARTVATVIAVLALFHLFATSIASLLDGVALAETRRTGGDYARLRLWGSIGFVVTSFSFGQWLALGGAPADVVPWVCVVALAFLAASFGLQEASRAQLAPPPSVREALRLLRSPALLLFLAANLVHWAALAPYHMLFAIHLESVGAGETAVGFGFAAAVAAEVVVMWRFRDLIRRLPLGALLGLAYGSGIVRWWLTGTMESGVAIAALQAIHGLTYGAFFVGSLLWLEREIPESLRITGRAVFTSISIGIGGVVGNLLAGALFDWGGSGLAFRAAALLELGAPLLLLASARVRRRG